MHGSYDAVANLGFTHGGKDVIERRPLTGRLRTQPPGGRLAVDQAKAFRSTEWDYGAVPRAPHHGWLHAADMPAEVIAADDETSCAWPRQSCVGALLAGHSAT